ncbi:hypothetical protein [Chondromyces apiculatus]|uniref:Heavy metal translocating P-type ATPase n=1 Tax=Chondromyces apiculatus DSM 436 TaxID=1192034 RepID=A0A017SWK6_9BACT|nr:hypothetical protein [Chondromyces apiculatus]EYF00696.1 heavy metal translocating P-type ATPase [Chondromyces apiculatus DSM 436]
MTEAKVPHALTALGFSPAAWRSARPMGFELCGLLAVLTMSADHAHALAVRRASAALTTQPPAGGEGTPNGAFDIAGRALRVAGIAFAAFAAALHATLGPGPLAPSAFTAPIAVLASCSLAAFWLGAPVMRAMALVRTRAAGLLVRDPEAFGRLARVDVVCVRTSAAVTVDLARAIDGLRARGVAVHLLGQHGPENLQGRAPLRGARAFNTPTPMAAALHVRDLQFAGFSVALVGSSADIASSRADLAIGLAAASPSMSAELSDGGLEPLAYALDISRAFQARMRGGATIAAIINAVLIPCAALGWCPPAIAALIALFEAILVLANTMRLPAAPRRLSGAVEQTPSTLAAVTQPLLQPAVALEKSVAVERRLLPQVQHGRGTGHILPAPSAAR